jgi:hypothetical protein
MILDLACLQEKVNKVAKALAEPSPALFELFEMEYQLRRPSLPISSSSPRWQHICRPVYTGPDDRWKAIIHVDFVKFCYDEINEADRTSGRDGLQKLVNTYRLFVSRESRSIHGKWDSEELKVIKYGAVRGTFAIQLGAFLLLIGAKHAGFADVTKGKSGFYKCLNEHKNGSYDHRELTTAEAQTEVDEVLRSLRSKGLKVCRAWLDQNGCRWWREQNDSLKNDLIFWDKESGSLFLQFRYKQLSKGEWQIQVYYLHAWQNYKDYWVPYYEVGSAKEKVKLRRESPNRAKLKEWVLELGSRALHDSEWCLDKV